MDKLWGRGMGGVAEVGRKEDPARGGVFRLSGIPLILHNWIVRNMPVHTTTL